MVPQIFMCFGWNVLCFNYFHHQNRHIFRQHFSRIYIEWSRMNQIVPYPLILVAHKMGWVFLFLIVNVFLCKKMYQGILLINPIHFLTLFDRISPKSPKLRADVGAVASVMSKFVHPSRSILHKYPNRLKNHKPQGVICVEVDAKVVRRGANAILVFVFTHFDFPN